MSANNPNADETIRDRWSAELNNLHKQEREIQWNNH